MSNKIVKMKIELIEGKGIIYTAPKGTTAYLGAKSNIDKSKEAVLGSEETVEIYAKKIFVLLEGGNY